MTFPVTLIDVLRDGLKAFESCFEMVTSVEER